jgi:hypothetical protein
VRPLLPVATIIFPDDENGYVTALLMHESRNEAGGQGSPVEIQADYSAYFGSYIVDIEGGVIIHRVSFTRSREGVPVIFTLAWKRISPSGH